MAGRTSPVTSRARSSSLRSALVAAALLGLCTLTDCARSTGNGQAASGVGYVRMKELVTKHPLYGQLSKYDDDIAALQLRSIGGAQVASTGSGLARQEAELQRELEQAADRTRELLKEKQTEYQDRENAAIKEALAAAGGPPPPGAAAIAGQMQATSNDQARQVAAQAQTNLEVFRKETIAQDDAAVKALRRSLAERADRTYRAKAEELREKESAFSLQLANADATQRLALRTKLSNLPLDDASRKDITDQLAALDRKESDALVPLRNRDQATLAALQAQLRSETTAEFNREVAEIHKRTNAKLADRATQTRSQLVRQLGGSIGAPTTVTAAAPAMSGDMKAKLLALHKKYQDDFQKDADQTVKAFYKTKDDLGRRFAELRGVDVGAQGDVQRQIQTLQRQRDELYAQMIDQIGREVKLVAERRAVAVVFSDIIAPVGGIDLTDDAEKDIESLHE